MYNQPYFIPGYFGSAAPSMMRGGLGARGALGGIAAGSRLGTASRGLGLFGRLGSSMQALKGINWGGLITNASKTLNVVNQAIPLVRQVGPMVNNMKSMLRVASIFKDETDVKPRIQNQSNKTVQSNYREQTNTSKDSIYHYDREKTNYNESYSYDTSPTFFVH